MKKYLTVVFLLAFAVPSWAAAKASHVSANDHPSRLLSAFFGLDDSLPFRANILCLGAWQKDGMPVIFPQTLDPQSLQAKDFKVTTRSGAQKTPVFVADLQLPDEPSGRVDQYSIGKIVARYLPENAIVSDESATNGLGPALALATAQPHDVLSLTGGSIGQGLPVAGGAAVACPDRKVVCLHGDGGAMYTVQSLWTQARENLDVTTVIFSNRAYAILQVELSRTGAKDLMAEGDTKALSMFDLSNPDIDWVKMAEAMGVEAVRVSTLEDFSSAFQSAMKQHGPRLIEVLL